MTRGWRGRIIFILVIAALSVAVIWLARQQVSQTLSQISWVLVSASVGSFLFGASVGFSEILSHYRDEPLSATFTIFGIAYLFLNGLISLAAFFVLRKYPDQILPLVKDDYLLTAVVAGFGAMVVFRSKFFTYRSDDGKDIPIGPSVVLDTIFKTIDAKIDRRRATKRQIRIFEKLHDIQDFGNMANYIEASLFSFQNLSQEDKTQIKTILDQYRAMTAWPDSLKSMGVGFAFLNIAGEENFDHVIDNLKKFVTDQKLVLAAKSGTV